MKITKAQIQKMIKEELTALQEQQDQFDSGANGLGDKPEIECENSEAEDSQLEESITLTPEDLQEIIQQEYENVTKGK